MNNYDVIIIGGGAAGCFAGMISAENGQKVLIVEKNGRTMRKLGITGKGRCNLTNNSDAKTVMANISRNPSFMYGALSRLSPEGVMDYFKGLGVPLKTERGQRVFPVSDKAGDIVNAVNNRLQSLGVEIIPARVSKILTENGAVKGVRCSSGDYFAEKVILATGGMSYPATGSTGDGYTLAKALGHTVTPIKPSLVPLVTEEPCADLMGLSLKNVTLTLYDNTLKKTLFSELGEMLFTHFGVSGPLVLSASSRIDGIEEGRFSLFIDLKPALDEKQLDLRIQRDFKEYQNREFQNSLRKLLPERLIAEVIKRTGIPPEKRIAEITREERKKLVDTLKKFALTVKAFRPIDEAIITDGGIDVKEISPKTMESKLVKGLYFAGEIIDVTGFTGGFNLQIAFSTAFVAANS